MALPSEPDTQEVALKRSGWGAAALVTSIVALAVSGVLSDWIMTDAVLRPMILDLLLGPWILLILVVAVLGFCGLNHEGRKKDFAVMALGLDALALLLFVMSVIS